jgi:hypothetical protein
MVIVPFSDFLTGSHRYLYIIDNIILWSLCLSLIVCWLVPPGILYSYIDNIILCSSHLSLIVCWLVPRYLYIIVPLSDCLLTGSPRYLYIIVPLSDCLLTGSPGIYILLYLSLIVCWLVPQVFIYYWSLSDCLLTGSPRYLNAIQTTCPHILRYLTTAVITNKSRRRTVMKDLVKVIQKEWSGQGHSTGKIWSRSFNRYDLVKVIKQVRSSQGHSTGKIWSRSFNR